MDNIDFFMFSLLCCKRKLSTIMFEKKAHGIQQQ